MKKNTVLIIEDNEMNMEIATFLLERAGIIVLKAENADSGVQIAIKEQPNLILVDMHLPFKDGFEICKELKNSSLTSHIPLVAFTALVMEEDKKKVLSSGCVSIISKPIEIDEFAQNVMQFL